MLDNSSDLVRYCKPSYINEDNILDYSVFEYRKKSEFRNKDETYISLYLLKIFETNKNQDTSLFNLMSKVKSMKFKPTGGFLIFNKGQIIKKFPEVKIIHQPKGEKKDSLHHVGLELPQDLEYLMELTDYLCEIGRLVRIEDLR